jgi:hypothetical protein
MLVRLKAPADAASGKQGNDLVYFGWRNTQAARSYAIPTNPQTANQTTVRAYFNAISKRWNTTISAAQRAGWSSYAATHQVTNRMGQLVTSTGLGMYIRCNTISLCRTNGLTYVDTAPTTPVPASPTGTNDSIQVDSASSFTTTMSHGISTVTDLWVMCKMEAMASSAVTPKAYREILCSGPNSASFVALGASPDTVSFTSTELVLSDGGIYGISFQIVDIYGQASQPFTKMVEGQEP